MLAKQKNIKNLINSLQVKCKGTVYLGQNEWSQKIASSVSQVQGVCVYY